MIWVKYTVMSIVVTDIVFQKEVLFVKYWLIDQKSVFK